MLSIMTTIARRTALRMSSPRRRCLPFMQDLQTTTRATSAECAYSMSYFEAIHELIGHSGRQLDGIVEDDAMMRVPQAPMTIAQLKRHMDRQFARLDRTKANKSDLRRFATKADL